MKKKTVKVEMIERSVSIFLTADNFLCNDKYINIKL